ncbi:vanadium-dependent haloperoxidase [Variovorax sp. YR752]|uniref:vanadium-dependent haloperoxidase n=1 Tax=Variovorax sp. YR752 TaxID=1884383 RepID=UPI0031379782
MLNMLPTRFARHTLALAAVLLLPALPAHADLITDWNQQADALIAESKLGTPPAVRVMALLQTAVADAVAATPADASADAAVAAAHRIVLGKLLPAQQAAVEAAVQAALAKLADGPAKAAGIAAGEKAAAELFARRADDNPAQPEAYRPHAAPGAYVPTAAPAIPQWPLRKPWLMASASQFRPGPPPALASERWARDFNEVRELGGRASTQRTAGQTEVARFWEYSLPAIYHGVLRSVALQPGRDVKRNARLFAAAAQAMDDALIGVFDAKYHHHFWRPATAIRNGDSDGNAATPREPGWAPLIDAPMHPEYPSGHSILAAAVATVIKADSGNAALPLATSSPSAKGAVRRWQRPDDFVREVSNARIWGGIHFRSATEAGEQMGQRIGELAGARHLGAAH